MAELKPPRGAQADGLRWFPPGAAVSPPDLVELNVRAEMFPVDHLRNMVQVLAEPGGGETETEAGTQGFGTSTITMSCLDCLCGNIYLTLIRLR